jgi:hypothetical protein
MAGFLIVLAACEGTEREEYRNSGALCLRSPMSGGVLVDVQYGCLSSSCDRLVSITCSIERSNAELRVNSLVVVDTDTGGSCTDDCGFARTSCRLADVEPGEYVIHHGQQSANVELPSAPLPLFEDGFSSACD